MRLAQFVSNSGFDYFYRFICLIFSPEVVMVKLAWLSQEPDLIGIRGCKKKKGPI